jgi:hypothetical protein
MAWRGDISLKFTATDEIDLAGNTAINNRIDYPDFKISLPNGTGAGQMDLGWQVDFTVTNTGTTFDLAAIAAAINNTGAATFNNIKGVLVVNTHATETLIIGNAASAQFNPGMSSSTWAHTIQPGGFFALGNKNASGWDAATARNFKIAAGTASATGVMVLFGED